MLSDRFIRNAKPGLYADEDGLYLQVYPSGKRSFLLRSQVGGKQRKKVLGAYPQLGLADARARAKRLREGAQDEITLAEAYDVYYQHLERTTKNPQQVQYIFIKDVLPTLGPSPLHGVVRADYTHMLDRIVKRGAPVMANRTLEAVRRFLRFCVDRGWIVVNPLEGVSATNIGGREVARKVTLDFTQIEDFLRLIRSQENGMDVGTRWALYLCLLTGQRASEVLSFKIGKKPWLEGPAKQTRAGPQTYKVPLTPHVRAAMKFFKTRPKEHQVLSRALRRLEQPFTPHDLRRTFASRMADIGVMPHVIEKLLNHQMIGMMAVYNHAEYWPERVAAQRLWGIKLAELRRKKAPD